MPDIFDWQKMADPREAIRRAVEALKVDELVGLPTETVYGIAADARSAQAVERLVHCKGRPEEKPLPLALRSVLDLPDWVPTIDKLGQRFSRRCWPGPLTLVFNEVKVDRLPEGVRRRVCPKGSIGFRVPDHEAIREVLHQLGGPLVLTSANRSGEPEAMTGREVLDAVGSQLSVVIDDGPTRLGQPSSVVRIDSGRWELLREGALRAQALEKIGSCVILFVCTGNTCRSPLAEGLCKKALADRIGCSPEELSRRGFLVISAGISAIMGCAATAEAVDTARELGVNLDGHVSRPLNYEMLAHASHIFTMTRSHREMLTIMFGPMDDRVDLLSAEGVDVADPIGGSREVYEQCARQIQECLEQRLARILDF